MKTTNHTSAPVWFITGASRGFGSEFARVALEHGCKVAATARKPEAVTQTLGEHEKSPSDCTRCYQSRANRRCG